MTRPARAGRAVLAGALVLAACADDGLEGPFTDPALVVDGALAETPAGIEPREAPPLPSTTANRRRAVQGFVRRGVAPAFGPAGRGTGADETAGDITLDFDGADVETVVRVMLGEALGANYVIDPAVRGTATFRTNRPLRRDEVLAVLEEILRLNDAAVVRQGGVFSVLPRQEAGLTAPLVGFRDVLSRGLTLRVTPLRFVGVEDVSGVLDDFAPVGGSITYDPRRDLVFTLGTEAEQATLMEVIATLDTDVLAGRSFALVPLDAGEPEAVVAELETLFAGGDGTPSRAIRFVAVERMNAVMIAAEDESAFEQALDLVRFLDQSAGETPRLHVFPVGARRAAELAELLGRIFDAEVATAGPAGLGAVDPRTGSPVAPGFGTRRDLDIGTGAVTGTGTGALGGAGTGLGTGAGGGARGSVALGGGVPGGGALGAGEAGAIPGGAGVAAGAGGAIGGGTAALSRVAFGERGLGGAGVLRVVADDSSNAIVALATASGAEALARALRRLDVQPLQVLIEATLVEVALTDDLAFGVRWFLSEGNFQFDFGDALGTGAASILPGFNAAFRTDDVSATLSALDSITDVRMLSSPTLMVLDNQIARLQVGDQVPVTVRQTLPVEGDDIIAETEFRDTGVILEIRPTVNASGAVTLQIRQEVSAVADTEAAGNPTFSQRVVESTISVQSGETIALAGLIEEDRTLLRDGIPVLSRLPVVGPIFGVNADNASRSELLVLIRPVVVRDQSDARAVTRELRQKLIGLVPRSEEGDLRRALRP